MQYITEYLVPNLNFIIDTQTYTHIHKYKYNVYNVHTQGVPEKNIIVSLKKHKSYEIQVFGESFFSRKMLSL